MDGLHRQIGCALPAGERAEKDEPVGGGQGLWCALDSVYLPYPRWQSAG